MHRGYVKTWRKILDNAISTDSYAYHLMSHCILKANYKDKTILFDGHPLVVKRGTFITSLAKLTDETGIKKGTLRSRLKLLQDFKILTHSCDNRKTLITVLNYDTYQPDEFSVIIPETRTVTRTMDRTVDTTNKDKKDKNIYSGEKTATKEVLDYFRSSFTAVFGKPYVPNWAKDSVIFKALLKDFKKEEVKTVIDTFFKSQDEFIKRSGYTVGVFKSQFNKLNSIKPKEKKWYPPPGGIR